MTDFKVLLVTNVYPNSRKPYAGIFVKRQVEAVEKLSSIRHIVVASRDSRRGVRFGVRKYTKLMLDVVRHSLFSDFRLIHAHIIFPAGLIALIPRFLRKRKLIITVHGGLIHTLPDRSSLLKAMIRLILRHADYIVVVSSALKKRVVELCGINEEKIEVINMGIDTNLFKPLPKALIRRKLSLPPEAVIVLFVGSLRPVKGLKYLMMALSLLRTNRLVQLYVIGQGQEEEQLRNLCSQLEIDGAVNFLGSKTQSEVAEWLAAADIFVMPSLAEGFGLAVLEALHCGTPVVASNVGGIPDFVVNGRNGFLVEPRNSEQLADRLSLLIDDEQVYQTVRQGATSVCGNYSVEHQAKKLILLYEQLLGTPLFEANTSLNTGANEYWGT
jgi:N-acetyl-alpha-D-glucosaminyl L-malate synthase BshA